MREEDRFEQGKRLSDRFFSLIPVGELKADETFIRGVRHERKEPIRKTFALLKTIFFAHFENHCQNRYISLTNNNIGADTGS
jgi:hypothetical protein